MRLFFSFRLRALSRQAGKEKGLVKATIGSRQGRVSPGLSSFALSPACLINGEWITKEWKLETLIRTGRTTACSRPRVVWFFDVPGHLPGAKRPNVSLNMMKSVALLALILASTVVARGQGTIDFVNLAGFGQVNAPVYESDGVTKCSGPQFMAELLAGPSGNTLASIATV
ncbi:MAG TPA: hypothetical protein VHI52_03685, partial [Verrucomicrobiae bacterium]|nr:hypothetical protein [Verrucomicrobiae bacterium]